MQKLSLVKKINDPRIDFSTRFEKQLEECPEEIKLAFREALALFIENPFHENLRNHPLHGKLAGYISIDVTVDYRALFKEKKTGRKRNIKFHMIVTHYKLYRKAPT